MEEGYEGRPPRKRVRGHFNYHGENYVLSITDPKTENKYLVQDIGYYPIDTVILCISLAEVWHGYAFRLIASVITPEQFKGNYLDLSTLFSWVADLLALLGWRRHQRF